nr:hypothetical protein [Tanacetum cinerariifolium]
MIVILEKYEHNQDFHQIVDFVEASHIRYALTFNHTLYVSHIRQFWSTARIETTEKGTKILATIDSKHRTVFESLIRRNLKLNDEAGINSLPDAELFANLQLMGYNILPNQKFTFQKGQFSHQWKYLVHTIMQCLSPKSTGFNEFSSNIATALVCLATNRVYNFSKMIFDVPPVTTVAIPPVIPTLPLPTVIPTDTTTVRHYTRRARIAQSLVLPPIADEPASPIGDDTQELEINSLKARIKLLEDKDRGVVEHSGDDAPIKGRSLDKGEEAAERVKSTPYTRRKGKEKMVESDIPKKKKLQEQIDVQIDDFIPMDLKEEAERFKRKGLRLEQKSAKKLKTSEEVLKEVKSSEEVPEEKVKEMMQLVHVEEVFVEALQVKHYNIDWKVHTGGQRNRKAGRQLSQLPIFVDMLKHFDREDLNQLWGLVKETFSIRPATKWKLYDICGVHHVSTKDQDIFMRIEKDYPQRKGLAIVMICYKLQVENYSQMENDLILKIHKIANRPRQKDD